MKIYAGLLFFAISLSPSLLCYSQNVPASKGEKFMRPVVIAYLGEKTNGASITAQQADDLIGLPLKVADKNNTTYTIDSYGFLYKRKGVTEDEQTGQKSINFTSVSDRFKTTPLPKVWIDNIKGNFQKDEELYFFDIVVKDKSNHLFLAPDLKITIQ